MFTGGQWLAENSKLTQRRCVCEDLDTLWLFSIAMKHGPFIKMSFDDLSIKHGDFPWLC
jgi:hypothetical protein